MATTLSQDIGTQTPVDSVGTPDTKVVKRKILWGEDGTSNNISLKNPLPIQYSNRTGGFVLIPGRPSYENDIDVSGSNNLAIQFEGTWTGSIDVLGSVDGVNFESMASLPSSVAANKITQSVISGLSKIRIGLPSAGKLNIIWRSN